MSEIVTPAQHITSDAQFMRGHGTFTKDDTAMHSSVAGQVVRVNKLISVVPLKQRYAPEIGDVVVGRIVDVGSKRWRVDLQSRQDAVLLLSSVNLPGGAQRRRLESDQQQMHKFFAEGDLVVAEVQQFFHDGAVSLHTRSLKYGKLKNGTLITVPASLIKRSKAHFITLQLSQEAKYDIILGVNGNVFVCPHVEELTVEVVELNPELLYTNTPQKAILAADRLVVAKICNLIKLLAQHSIYLSEEVLKEAYECCVDLQPIDLPKKASQIVERLVQRFS